MEDPSKWWMDLLDDRQKKEMKFARDYALFYQHGTDGHNRLMLMARLAEILDGSSQNPPWPEDEKAGSQNEEAV